MQEKTKWYLCLLIDIVLFILGLLSRSIALNLVVIGLSLVIYRYGNPVLFETINKKRQEKLAESNEIRKAVTQVIQDRKLFSKK